MCTVSLLSTCLTLNYVVTTDCNHSHSFTLFSKNTNKNNFTRQQQSNLLYLVWFYYSASHFKKNSNYKKHTQEQQWKSGIFSWLFLVWRRDTKWLFKIITLRCKWTHQRPAAKKGAAQSASWLPANVLVSVGNRCLLHTQCFPFIHNMLTLL